MNYNDALKFIDSDDKRGHNRSLDTISRLLLLLGNPQDSLKFIHLTGTNGKGSTANFISTILEAGGYKTGLFTSPHILSINERFQINHEQIKNDKFASYMTRIRDVLYENKDLKPTYFEITVALGMLYFKENNVDIVVMEVGIGGRVDPTNIIKTAVASVFTPISIDHRERLGNTAEEAAIEKSGIIKKNSVVVSYFNSNRINEIIRNKAESQDSKICFLDMNDIKIISSDLNGSDFIFLGTEYHIRQIGIHQIYNASLAILTIKSIDLNINDDIIKNAISNIQWSARMTIVKKSPITIIDGAHNEHGFDSLINNINKIDRRRLIICLGIMKDKDIGPNLKELISMADVVLFTKIEYERAMPENELKDLFPSVNYRTFSKLEDAVAFSQEIADNNDLVIFTGSLYMAGELIKLFEINK